ncbi:hypothetical protein KM043_005355 [Ampulex compressa]|nr:hypothetical protein KM043_005355 [Ampulex compressa]
MAKGQVLHSTNLRLDGTISTGDSKDKIRASKRNRKRSAANNGDLINDELLESHEKTGNNEIRAFYVPPAISILSGSQAASFETDVALSASSGPPALDGCTRRKPGLREVAQVYIRGRDLPVRLNMQGVCRVPRRTTSLGLIAVMLTAHGHFAAPNFE